MELPTLYKLADSYRELELLLGSDDEIEETELEAIETTLDALRGDIREKATNVAAYVLNAEALAKAARDAAERLEERASRIERRTGALREYIRVHLLAADIKKVESPEFTVSIRANPPSVRVAPDAEIPQQYIVTPPPPLAHPDKRALKQALQRGEEIKGVTLESSDRLDIRV